MANIITIKNLNFSYDKDSIFKDFNLDIKLGSFVSLIGPNGSGKSTLFKILAGLVKYDGEILIDGISLIEENIYNIRKKIGFISGNLDNQFVAEKVVDNIAFPLENMNMNREKILDRVKEVAELLDIKELLNKNIFVLNNMEKTLVNLAAILVYNPRILLLDEAFSSLDSFEKEKIFSVLKTLNEKNNLTIINITQNMEDILFGERVIILDKGKIIENNLNEKAFLNDRSFYKLGLNLPFMVDLSIKLKYYSLTDRIIYNMEEMADNLWK